MKGKTKILIVLASMLLGVAFALFFVFSDAVAEDRFTQVHDGMTEAQVRELLGIPHHVRRDAPDRTAFYYGGFQRLNLKTAVGRDGFFCKFLIP